jgi:hypothetical protein
MRRIMAFLRRVLYWEAALWAFAGLAVAIAPRLVIVTLFDQVAYPEYSAFRLVGLQAFGLSLLSVLVAQRVQDHWWWSWAVVIVAAGATTIFALTALFAVPEASAAWAWWVFAGLGLLSAVGLLVGMAYAGSERPGD